MLILSLDTSTEACSAALLHDQAFIFRHEVAPRQHSLLILPMIEQLLAEAQANLSQLDLIAFGRGPGAFTGVRLAAAITQGIAYARDLPVAGVSSLACLAQGLYRERQVSHCLAAIDARMQEIYWAFYSLDEQGVMIAQSEEQVSLPHAMSIVQVAKHLQQDWQGAGSGFDRYADEISEVTAKHRGVSSMPWLQGCLPHAIDTAILGRALYERGEIGQACDALPHYVRNNVAQQPKNSQPRSGSAHPGGVVK